jgi:hypothetical protein
MPRQSRHATDAPPPVDPELARLREENEALRVRVREINNTEYEKARLRTENGWLTRELDRLARRT